jgi:malic enzyme
MIIEASNALQAMIANPTKDKILPNPLDKTVGKVVGKAVRKTAEETGVARV